MKRKTVKRFIIILAAGMLVTSSTGCGTKVSATDAEVPIQEETVIVAQEDADTESDDQTIMETETVGEAENERVYVEHEYFFAVEKDSIDWTASTEKIDMDALIPGGSSLELHNSLDVYTPEGIMVGYTKPNVALDIFNYNDDWYCFEFANDNDFHYLLIKQEDVKNDTGVETKLITQEDVISYLEEYFSNAENGYELLDAPEPDMDFVELSISQTDWDYLDNLTESTIGGDDDRLLRAYAKFYIEGMESKYNDRDIWVRVYYKDLKTRK